MSIYKIELQPQPNQSFSLTINNVNMNINLRMAGTNENPIMLFSLQINDEYVCPHVPCFANQGLLPYNYMVSEAGGNFFFETDFDEYPIYTDFGTTCNLFFITQDELEG